VEVLNDGVHYMRIVQKTFRGEAEPENLFNKMPKEIGKAAAGMGFPI